MKYFNKLLKLIAATVITMIPVQASATSWIELTYSNSQYQCDSNSPQLEILVNIYHNGALLKENLAVGESILVPSLQGLSMDYTANNASCEFTTPTELHLTQNDPIPNLPGAYDQDNIATLLSGLNQYEDLYLVELGTTDTNSFAYDLQDAVFIVNNNPVLPD